MSACGDKELLLQGMLDGELDAVNTLAFEAHMRECPACAAEFDRLLALRNRLRAPEVKYLAPAALRARIRVSLEASSGADAQKIPSTNALADSALRAVPAQAAATRTSVVQPPRRRRFVPWMLGGSTAALAACLALVLLVYVPGRGLGDELVASHVRSLQVTHLTDVETSDRHVVKPWFQGKVDFSPPIIELADRGFPLVGGRLDYLQGKAVAAVVYMRRQHVINVFVWPAGSSGALARVPAHRDGYNLLGWRQDGLQFWAVSDLDAAELQQLRAAFDQRAGE